MSCKVGRGNKACPYSDKKFLYSYAGQRDRHLGDPVSILSHEEHMMPCSGVLSVAKTPITPIAGTALIRDSLVGGSVTGRDKALTMGLMLF